MSVEARVRSGSTGWFDVSVSVEDAWSCCEGESTCCLEGAVVGVRLCTVTRLRAASGGCGLNGLVGRARTIVVPGDLRMGSR